MSFKLHPLSSSRANSEKESTKANATLYHEEEAMLNREDLPLSSPTFMFPLHNAAEEGNLEKFKALLSAPGSDPFKQDFKGRTILHYAVSFGTQSIAIAMTEEVLTCSAILIADNVILRRSQLVNVRDNDGETALHLSARAGHRKIVQLLIPCGADVNIKSNDENNNIEPIELIYEKVPQVLCALFDKAITYQSGEIEDDSLVVLLDFASIVGYEDDPEEEDPYPFMESKLLANALKTSASKCQNVLMHPLVQLFLHLKWKKVRLLLWASIFIHFKWLLVFSTFLLDLYVNKCPYLPANVTDTSTEEETKSGTENLSVYCVGELINCNLAWLAALISVMMAFKEIYELKSSPSVGYYFSQLENLGQLLLILIVALTTLPVWIYLLGTEDSVTLHPWQYQTAAFGILIAWALILSQIGNIPTLGLYVKILFRVLRSFGFFVLTFTSLLIAFALSFSILMPKNEAFASWPMALSKVLIMMIGELNYDELFYNDEPQLIPTPFRATGHVLFALFVVIVTIILFNLLIGLTVSDIQGLQKEANVELRVSQLEQIFIMESFLCSKHFKRIFNFIGLIPNFLKIFQISKADHMFKVKISMRNIPPELQNDVKDLVLQNLNEDVNHCSKDQEIGSNTTADNLKVIIKDVLLRVLQEHFPRN